MSYFTNRPRAYSKPTKEETKELTSYLSQCSAHELRHIMLSAASQSPDVAQVLMNAIKDTDLAVKPHLQPVRPTQQRGSIVPAHVDTGLLTPIYLSEDSEMGGVESAHQGYHHHHSSADPNAYISTSTVTPTSLCQPTSSTTVPSLKRPNKRKSLADRDDNIPTPPHPSSHTKRHKPTITLHPSMPHPTTSKTHCLNCGQSTQTDTFENPYGCIYHPGPFHVDATTSLWSCCRDEDMVSIRCTVSQHRVQNRDMWLNGQSGHVSSPPQGGHTHG